MARKDDLKLLFNFMIELLKDEEQTKTETVETKKTETELLKETKEKVDAESAKHILDVMKRVEILDKIRRPKTVLPLNQRDEDEIAKIDKEIIKTHQSEKPNKSLDMLKKTLVDAKEFMVDLERQKPVVPSMSLHELNEVEQRKSEVNSEESKNTEPKTTPKLEKTPRKRK